MKIAVLLSGGVDSSVALQLLCQNSRHDITAFYLKIWLEEEIVHLGECPWKTDMEYVRLLCEQLHVPFQVISLQQEYQQKIISYVLDELRHGRTPSPDILCNQYVKFGDFYQKIDAAYDKVATGHYAQIKEKDGVYYLLRSPDPVKDQTYFLHSLNQQQLKRALYPIGHLHKKEVRCLAHFFHLPTKSRKDSQGICFLGKIKYPDFIKHHLGEKKGKIIHGASGKVLGEHDGYWFFTIGQRHGLGLSGGPWYVVSKDIKQNIIVVAHKHKIEETKILHVSNINWITEEPQKDNIQLKIRHGTMFYHGVIVDRLSKNSLTITIEPGDIGVAPGQFAIFYDKEICLGGGVICR